MKTNILIYYLESYVTACEMFHNYEQVVAFYREGSQLTKLERGQLLEMNERMYYFKRAMLEDFNIEYDNEIKYKIRLLSLTQEPFIFTTTLNIEQKTIDIIP